MEHLLSAVAAEDIKYHISNSCEGYQDNNLYFTSVGMDADGQLIIHVYDEDGDYRTWILTLTEAIEL